MDEIEQTGELVKVGIARLTEVQLALGTHQLTVTPSSTGELLAIRHDVFVVFVVVVFYVKVRSVAECGREDGLREVGSQRTGGSDRCLYSR